jgi:hypothetical protein
MQTICSECGQPFDDGDQCWVCVARTEDIKETFYFCLCVALAGILALVVATGSYPPLKSNLLAVYMILAEFIIPGAIVFLLVLSARLTGYASFVRIVFVLAATASVVPAAYYFLNGALDDGTPVESHAVVSEKYINNGRGAKYNLAWTLPWNHENIKGSIGVQSETFSIAEPGDSVRVMVHPGQFSQPWYSDVHFRSRLTGDSR